MKNHSNQILEYTHSSLQQLKLEGENIIHLPKTSDLLRKSFSFEL